jgi:very-short-patch-repair endonuclease
VSPRRHFIPYRRDLKRRSQALRRDPSPAERKLWYEFLRDLPVKFTRQKPLGRYIADFYCASRMVVIELDGDSHFSDRAQRYDKSRTAALSAEGIRVLRVMNTDVMQNFEGVCETIRRVLDAEPKNPPLASSLPPYQGGET